MDGERLETSPIVKGIVENGSVVQTASGTRYFLSTKTVEQMKQVASNFSSPQKELPSASTRATLQLTQKAKKIAAEKAMKSAEQASPRVTISLSSIFGFGDESDKKTPQPKMSSPKPLASRAAKTTTSDTSATMSLGSIFNAGTSVPTTKMPTSAASAKKKEAPRGIPTIERWKVEQDKAVTGFIRGSSQFRDGEKVTTSPISKGRLAKGEVVVTSSGTRYFLK
jgi:hypothetical protein